MPEKNVVTVRYLVYKSSSQEQVPVCQKAFLNSLRLSKNLVHSVISRNFKRGAMPVERRGGDWTLKIYEEKKQSVLTFIKRFMKKNFPSVPSPDINIRKMWKMYDAEMLNEKLKVKYSYFCHIFRTKFNIEFGSPSTDKCSTCISLCERIKSATQSVEK
ncbi:hypothetical protein PR048_008832 [Dryococelus australis]|uniref:Transposase n=1 Tax=Dryococelus australis TaxID=614101 RepID=A0ABQ9HY74_9NEOP|nr:hypothetical protein PR048_008832 [Dryococelus australis]